MAIVAVQQPRQKRDPLDRVLKGLQIAQSVFGIKSALEQTELEKLQEERARQQIKAGELDIAKAERQAFLSTEGIIPGSDFNKEYFKVESPKVEEFQKKFPDYPLLPIKIKVEDPNIDEGFREVLALPREDLKEARKAAKEAKKEEPKPKPTAKTFEAAGYAERISFSNKIFDDLEKTGFDRASYGTALVSALASPFGELGEAFKDEELKLWEQSTRNFVNAVLRRESGAAIAESEFESAAKQYFPMAGDTPEVKAQKRKNRELVEQALRREAEFGMTGQIVDPSLQRARQTLGTQQTGNPLIPQTSATAAPQEDSNQFLQRYLRE